MKKLLAFLLCSTLMLGDSVGPTSGTATGSGWTTPANVGASDNAYATYAIAATSGGRTCSAKAITLGCEPEDPTFGISSAISISSLGFAIPAAATVTGITATFEHKCSGSSSCSTGTSSGGKIQLTKVAGTGQGTNKGNSTTWDTIDSTETLGSSTDLWGSTWTGTDINAAGFGLVVVVLNSNSSTRTASIDYMALTVSYSPSGSGSHRRVIISQTRTIAVRAS